MKRMLLTGALALGLLPATGAWAESLLIKVTAVDATKGEVMGASPEMPSDVRTFHYRDQTKGIKLADIQVGETVRVDYDASSGVNWLDFVEKK
jgi:hypothetical protein